MFAIPRSAALAAVFVVALSIQTAAADPITVVWDPNPPAEGVLGYQVVVSDPSGIVGTYDVGNQTSFVFPDAVPGLAYVFSVAAYNGLGVGIYTSIPGFSDAPPVLAHPGDRASLVGEAVFLQLLGSDLYDDPITYAATGLPPGFTLDPITGLIEGTGTTAGAYLVTVSVSDGVLDSEQTFNWYVDGALPVVAITSPTTQPTHTVSVGSIAVGGTTSDDVGIASVGWVNSRGGTGYATLTSATTWLIASLTLKVGDNVITVTASDFANRTAIATLTVTFEGGVAPVVVIDNPTSAPTFTTSNTTILLAGTASPGLTSMTWSTDRGASGNVNFFKPPAANFSIWNIPSVPLQPGVNVVTVSARDVFEAVGTAVLAVTLNRPPVITNPGAQSSLQGVDVTLPVTASDLDGNPLTWTALELPPGLSIDSSSGVVSGLPTETGQFLAVVAVSDGLASDVESFSWTVSAVTVTAMVTAADKPYDGSTTATLTSCTVAGILAGHVVGCTGTAAFDSPTAAAGKPVTVNGLTLTGPDAGYYELASTVAGTTAAITPLPVMPHITAANKPYDGTISATLTSCTVTGALSGDVVACDGTITFDTADAGTGKTVSAVGLWLTGAAAGNYFLSTATATTTATITTRPVTAAVTVADKAYDGTTAATLTSCTVSGAIGGDAVSCAGTPTFDTASAGAGKTVTVAGLVLTGAAAGNYALPATASTSAAITPLSVTATVTAADKAYDGTTGATLTNCSVAGAIAGDVVACGGIAAFDTASAGAGKPVTASGLTLVGPSAGNYVLSSPTAATTASINTLTVTPVVTVSDKPYDRTTTATLSSCTLGGAVAGDVVTCTGTAAFDSAAAGTGNTVTVSGIALAGAAAGNYVLASTTATATAAITALPVTPAVTAANKVYDRTTSATLTSCTVTGALEGDVVGCTGTVAFESAAVGTAKTVTTSGLALTGAAAANYALSSATATTTASITAAMVSPEIAAANKAYDGTTAATLTTCAVTGGLEGDEVGCVGSATFDSATVGVGKTVTASGLTLTGAAAANYALSSATAATTASITAAAVSPLITAANKVYDGTTSATLTSCTVTGVLEGDLVACTGTVAFDSAAVGTGKTVTTSGLTLTGAAAANYALSSATAATTASITAAVVSPVITAANKVYDGTTAAALACTVGGAIDGDAVACAGSATFDSATVGTSKTVTASGLALTGSGAGNYVLNSTTATTTAAITARTVTAVVTAADKPYDATTTATLINCTVGALEGDLVGCTGTIAFDSAAVGTGKTVTTSGLTLTGAAAGNYALSSTTAATTAAITPLTLTPAVTAANKVYDGNTAATLASCTVAGGLEGDIVGCTGTAAFDSAAVAAGKSVTISGLTVTGAAAANYVLASATATTTASITAATVSPVIAAANRVYDGSTAATLESCTVTGALEGDVVGCTGTAAFDSPAVGTSKTVTASGLTLTGAAAANYLLSSADGTTTANISAATVAPAITVDNKVYDGAATAVIATCTVTGVLGGDVVGCTGTAAFDTATVAVGKNVTATGITLTGAAASNYILSVTTVTTTAAITPATVVAAITAADKTYDGTTSATLTSCTLTGVIGGDVVGCTGGAASFDSPAAGAAKPVTATGLTLTGAGAGNYVLSSTTATTTATITNPDTSAPTLAVTAPTSTGTHTTTSGTASDNIGVTQVSWTTSAGASGVATGTSDWSIASVPLDGATTVITVTARDAANNTANATLTVTLLPPAAATLIAPIGTISTTSPSYSWAAVTGATHYQLWVNDATEQARINVTYTAAAVGCSTVPGTCSVSPGTTLVPGAAQWWIRPSNAAGPSPWGAGLAFTVPSSADTTAPSVALTTPTTGATYTAPNGMIAFGGTASDNVGVTQVSWTTDRGTSGVATGTSAWTIAAMPLPAGTTLVTVTARDAASNTANTTLTISYTPPAPDAVTLLAPTGTIATATPTFSWTAGLTATHYQLWVNDATTGAKINITYPAAAVGCGAGTGTCTVSPGVTLAPGVAMWWIRPSNGAGAGPWGSGFTFTVPAAPDTVAPSIALTSPTSTGTYTATSGTLAVGGTASDNVGVTQVSWTTNGGASGVASGTTAWSVGSVPLSVGTTVVTVTARDAANNTTSAMLTVTYNSLPPGAATLLTPTGTIATATPSFSWTAVSDATHYQLWVNDATTGAKINTSYPAAAVGCGAGTGTCTVSPGVTLAAGVAAWWIRPSNGAGAGPWGSGASFVVPAPPDTTMPAVALTTPTGTGTYTATNGTLAVGGIAGDNVGVTQVSWTTNHGASGLATGTTAWSIAAVPLGAGTTVITVTARDAANNTASTMLTVTYNSLPPGAATLLAPTGTIATSTPSFSWTAVSGATEYLLWVNDAATGAKINIIYPAAAVGCGAGTGTCTVSPGVTLAAGVAMWWIRPSNGAGPGPWGSGLAFTVPAAPDTTAPSVAVTAPTSTGTYAATSGTLAVGGTASDNLGVTQVSWSTNGGASGVATGTTAWSIASVPLGAGTTVITVTARDAANNIASTTLTVTFTLASLPTAATLLTPTGTIGTATPSFSWEAVSGATEYQLWVNDATTGAKINTTYTAEAAGCGAGTGTCTVSPGVVLAQGSAMWWIRTSNTAGPGPWSSGLGFTVSAP